MQAKANKSAAIADFGGEKPSHGIARAARPSRTCERWLNSQGQDAEE